MPPSQAVSSAEGVAVTFRDALARLPRGRGPEAPPPPGEVEGPPFPRRNRGSPAGATTRAPPTRGSGPLIGWAHGDVVGLTDSTPGAGRAGGYCASTGLCSVFGSPGFGCVLAEQPEAGASSSSRRRCRRHGVPGHCGECASAQALEPPVPGERRRQATPLGGPRKPVPLLGGRGGCHGPSLLTPSAPLLRAPPVCPQEGGKHYARDSEA